MQLAAHFGNPPTEAASANSRGERGGRKLKVRKMPVNGDAPASDGSRGSTHGGAHPVRSGFAQQTPASQSGRIPSRQPASRPAMTAAPLARLLPQQALPQHQFPSQQQQHALAQMAQMAPFAEGTHGHFLHLQQLAASRRRAELQPQHQHPAQQHVIQHHLQPQMRPQARPPFLPAPVSMVPASPVVPVQLPRPPPVGPAYGAPQAWPGRAGAPPPWQGGPPHGRGTPARGPLQQEMGGRHAGRGGRDGGRGAPPWHGPNW